MAPRPPHVGEGVEAGREDDNPPALLLVDHPGALAALPAEDAGRGGEAVQAVGVGHFIFSPAFQARSASVAFVIASLSPIKSGSFGFSICGSPRCTR